MMTSSRPTAWIVLACVLVGLPACKKSYSPAMADMAVTDAGYGGALYVNDMLVDHTASDLWWGYQWNRGGELLEASGIDLTQGLNTIDVFWAEGCCNGRQSGRFTMDGGNGWLELSVDNLEAVSVPEPGTSALVALGLAGLAWSRRRRSTDS